MKNATGRFDQILRHFGVAQTTQAKTFVIDLVSQAAQHVHQRMSATEPHVRVAVGADDEQARLADKPRQVTQQLERIPVCPVQVIEHHENRLISRGGQEELSDRVEESEARLIRSEQRRRRRRGQRGAYLGQQRRQQRHALAELSRQPLEIDEARAALNDGDDCRSAIGRRKAERLWIEAHPGPSSHGQDPGPPPSFEKLGPELRMAMNSLLWTIDRVFASQQSTRQPRGSVTSIQGIAASPGVYSGPVRVVLSESEFGKIRPGDVLVCPVTSPVWSVLFPNLGGLVTDSGGLLSHPAIIAREYGIPAVVATGQGTRAFQDGQIVTVNGTSGRVELDTESPSPVSY